MSDDLVQRLRDYPSYEECLQAADRIEALEAALREIDAIYPVVLFEHNEGTKVRNIARRALEGKS